MSISNEKKQQKMLNYQEKAVSLHTKCLFSYMKTGIFAKHFSVIYFQLFCISAECANDYGIILWYFYQKTHYFFVLLQPINAN